MPEPPGLGTIRSRVTGGRKIAVPHAVDTRARALRASRSYRPVLALAVASFLFLAFSPDEPWSRGTLLLIEAAMLVVALWTSREGGLAPRLLIVAVAVLVALAQLISDGRGLTTTAALLNGAFLVAVAVVIAGGIVSAGEVNQQTVTGAITVYLLLGLFFSYLYSVMAVLGSGSFFAQGTDGTTADRLYFSFVTLTTVGYGDYAPAGDLGHTLANLEALVGQLYLVTVVALLVSQMPAAQRSDR